MQLCTKLPEPTFEATHAVSVQENVLDATELLTPEGSKDRGLPRNTFEELRGRSRSARYKTTEKVFEDTQSSDLDSSDQTWQPGIELSPSSCEYLSHLGLTASAESDFDYRDAYRREKTVNRSASPLALTHQLRSGRRRRKSPQTTLRVECTTEVFFLTLLELAVDHVSIV